MSHLFSQLKKRKYFLISVLTTMSLTLGAFSCFFGLNYVLFFGSLPYPEQQKLYVVGQSFLNETDVKFSDMYAYPELMYLHDKQDIFTQGAVIGYSQEIATSISGGPNVSTGYASPEFYQILSAPLALGRHFQSTENVGSFNPVIIISFQAWKKYFNLSRDILGEKILISGVSFAIVGVLAESFIEPEIGFSGRKTDFWLPWDYSPAPAYVRAGWDVLKGDWYYLGKLKENISLTEAESRLSTLLSSKWEGEVTGVQFLSGLHIEAKLIPLSKYLLGDAGIVAFLLIIAAFSLVGIAIANVSNLYLSRTAEQRKEMAIRASVGATKAQLFEEMFVESAVLMLSSGVLALLLSQVGYIILRAKFAEVLPRLEELRINIWSVSITFSIAILSAYIIAKVRTNVLKYDQLSLSLKSSVKGGAGQISKGIRHLIIGGQVALATFLLFVNVFLCIITIGVVLEPIGFATAKTYHLQIAPAAANSDSSELAPTIMKEFSERLAEIAEIESVSHSSSPFSFDRTWPLVSELNGDEYSPQVLAIDNKYFKLIGQTILFGDDLSSVDVLEHNKVVVINNSFAKKLEPTGNAVGMRLRSGDDVYTISGVVSDIRYPNSPADTDRVYGIKNPTVMGFVLKFKPGQQVAQKELAATLASVSNRFVIFNFYSLEEQYGKMLFLQIATVWITLSLIVLVLFLAAIGLYGVISYNTQLRLFELGCRAALGATGKNLLVFLIKDNFLSVLFGYFGFLLIVFLGLFCFWSYLEFYLTWKVILIGAVCASVIALVCLVASYLPFRRYLSKPPVSLLYSR